MAEVASYVEALRSAEAEGSNLPEWGTTTEH